MITTTKGDMDEALLQRVDGGIEDDNEKTTWVEYWLGNECVHRSVHVHLKRATVFGEAIAASL